MIPSTPQIVIPDLRFEQVFRRSLSSYADKANASRREISAKELDQYKAGVDDVAPLPKALPPVEPSSPTIVTYAIIRDIMLRPLLESFVWAMICISARPVLRLVTRQGWRVGNLFASLFGIRPATL